MVSCTTLFFCVSFFFFFFSVVLFSSASDSISAAESIKPGQTLVSAGGIFELGFFNPGNSVEQYVGIWYKMSKATIVWVANRESPVVNTPGILRLTQQGSLTILDRNETLIWSSNSSRLPRISPSGQLLDSGNFVVMDGNSNSQENILWQGFDYPTDTQLPGMKIGRYVAENRDVYQSEWRSDDDPAEGDVTLKLEINGVPEFFLSRGSTQLVRSGPWNGLAFSGRSNLKQNNVYKFGFYSDSNWIYYAFEPHESSVLLRTVISQAGDSQMLIWNEDAKSWNSILSLKTDHCDTYALCGTNAACNINNSPLCECLKGFVPESRADWDAAGWSTGCIRQTPLNCSDADGFVRHSGVKVPETRNAWSNNSMTLEECRMSCLKNCSCTAYTNSDIRNGGTGCLMWFSELIDIREYPKDGQDIFIKLAHSELDGLGVDKSKQIRTIIISVLSATVTVFGLVLIVVILKKMKWRLTQQETLPTAAGQILTSNSKRIFGGTKGDSSERGNFRGNHHKDYLELPLFDFEIVAKATNDFSNQNKLGQGGFGPVYKGVLEEGQEIAVKRLSSESKQGMDEFANEVLCIVKLQHRNLVKLLGCCIDKEKMLVYEFMSNKSLDFFIFDEKKRMLLDWPKRINIINGIARGLLYLHRDSRLRIIHRDLKASNILLDHDMNPKISDFGMARCFGGNETSANTARVVGTYGYMSPEYVIDGIFSMKSDVFSYGVLVLEIITGKKNRGFYHKDHHLNLLGHAWGLYDKGGFTELVDDSISDSCNLAEILRCIHVGLLCVQQNPEDRPNMATVVLMLSNEISLPEPKKPGFFTARHVTGVSSSSSNQESCSTNEMSMTLLAPR